MNRRKPESSPFECTPSAEQEALDSLHRRYLQETAEGGEDPVCTDADRYRWIRDHRGNHLINEALMHADHDTDFDVLIDAAMKAHKMGRHLGCAQMPSRHSRRQHR